MKALSAVILFFVGLFSIAIFMAIFADSSSKSSEPLSNPPASEESSDIQAVLDREPARSIQILKRRAVPNLDGWEGGSWTVGRNTEDCPSEVEGNKYDCQEVIYKVAQGEARWLVLFESGTRGATRPYIKPLNAAARDSFTYPTSMKVHHEGLGEDAYYPEPVDSIPVQDEDGTRAIPTKAPELSKVPPESLHFVSGSHLPTKVHGFSLGMSVAEAFAVDPTLQFEDRTNPSKHEAGHLWTHPNDYSIELDFLKGRLCYISSDLDRAISPFDGKSYSDDYDYGRSIGTSSPKGDLNICDFDFWDGHLLGFTRTHHGVDNGVLKAMPAKLIQQFGTPTKFISLNEVTTVEWENETLRLTYLIFTSGPSSGELEVILHDQKLESLKKAVEMERKPPQYKPAPEDKSFF